MIARHGLSLPLRDPRCLGNFTLPEWSLLLRQARPSGLIARLAWRIEEAGMLEAVPEPVRPHLAAECVLAAKHERDVRFEVRCLSEALAPLGIPLVLLKGAAYVMAALPPARGRLFRDIDILVPRAEIGRVEETLARHGWALSPMSAYDERYYRRWMHEIPPMIHVERRTTVDVHHTIVPETTGLALDAAKLFAAARPIDGTRALHVLSPADMTLHSATHLFNEGDFRHGLRDLDDIDRLLRHFGTDPDFWPRLAARAVELDLRRPLYYALRYGAALLGTPVPPPLREAAQLAPPATPLQTLMDRLFDHALRANHASCRTLSSPLALWLLYVRAHYLRLPPHLLLPHLLRKAYMRWFERD